MLSESEVERVRELLGQAFSYREIQRITGINRGTIGRIARGERPDYEALRRQRQTAEPQGDRAGPAVRCPQCGRRVHPPCRFCRTRAATAKSPRPRAFGGNSFDERIKLELRPVHQARYAEVRAWKLRRTGESQDGQS